MRWPSAPVRLASEALTPEHDAPPSGRPGGPPPAAFSLLRLSVAARLGLVGVMVAAIWLMVAWAER